MRICLLISQSPPFACASDEFSFFQEIAPQLAAAGHDVTVITDVPASFPAQTNLKTVAVRLPERIKNLKLVDKVLPKAHSFALKQLSFWNVFAEVNAGQKFDLVHAPASQAGTLLSAVAREIASILTIGRNFTFDSATKSSFDESFETLVTDYVFNCADAICFVSDENKGALVSQISNIDRISSLSGFSAASTGIQMVACYEQALENFSKVNKPKLYRHGAQRLVKSTEDMIMLFDRMLYDLLFRVSYRFRLKHWISMLIARPEVFASKLRNSLGLKG